MSDDAKKSIILQPLSDENLIKLSQGQVTNYGDYNLSSNEHPPVLGGLFDYKIFGCLKKCYCGRTTKAGTTCPACGARVVTREEAEERCGHYILNYPYVSAIKVGDFVSKLVKFNPMFEALYRTPEGKSVRSGGKLLVRNLYNYRFNYIPIEESDVSENGEDLIVSDSNGLYKVVLDSYEDSSLDFHMSNYGPSAFKKLLTKYNLHESVKSNLEFISKYVNQVVIITPITSRPATVTQDPSGKWVVNAHVSNSYYRALIAADQSLPKLLDSVNSLADKLAIYYSINRMVDLLQDTFSITATSKQNLIRNKFVQIVKKTGRANIISGTDLPIDTIRIPRSMAYESLKNEVIKYLKLNNVQDPIAEYENPSETTIKIFENIVANSCVLFLRNPTLHRYNLSAFKVELWDEIAIAMPLLSVHLFNADFDGDQMAFFFITEPNLVKKTLETMGVDRNWEFEKNNSPIYAPDASILQGLYVASGLTKYDRPRKYYLSKDKVYDDYKNDRIEVDEEIDYMGSKTTYGRLYISDIIGKDLDDLLGDKVPINSKSIGTIMTLLSTRSDKVERVKKLQDLALETITYSGNTTISINDIFKTDPKFPELNEILNSKLDDSVKYHKLNDIIPGIIEKQVRTNLETDNLVKIIDGSGKIKKDNLPPLFGPRIEYSPEKGLTVFDESISQGMSEGAHVHHAIENREILIVKQELVPTSGYFARQLVSINYDILFTENPSQSKTGIVSKAKYVQGRIKIDGNSVTEKGDTLIRVKSCVDGETDRVSREELSSKNYAFKGYKENDAIGISFGTSVSESLTQSALGLKHGGALLTPSKDKLISLTPGRVISKDDFFITVEDKGTQYKYPYPFNLVLSEYSKGKEFPAGTILGYSGDMIRAEYRLESIFALINSYSDTEKVKKSDIRICICYSPTDGVITYDLNRKNPIVKIGGKSFPYSNKVIYKYPDGHKVSKGERISTGVIKIADYCNLVDRDMGWTFYAFKSQIDYSLNNDKVNSELYEVLFKGLIRGNFSVRDSHKNTDKLLNEINLGYAKRSISKFVDKDIGDGLLTRLILQNL